MSITLVLDAFEETPLTEKKCVYCGNSVNSKNTSGYTGPKEKNTCSYSCYRSFWLFKNILGDFECHPNFVAYLITQISNGMCVEQVKKIYKAEKKRKFMGPYKSGVDE